MSLISIFLILLSPGNVLLYSRGWSEQGEATCCNKEAAIKLSQSEGSLYNSLWLVKVNAMGEIQWNKVYGQRLGDFRSRNTFSIVQTPSGDLGIAGMKWIPDVHKSMDMLLVITNNKGDTRWNNTYGGTGEDWANSLVYTSDRGFVMTGYTEIGANAIPATRLVKTEHDGTEEWNKYFLGLGEGLTVIRTSDGGYAVASRTQEGIALLKVNSKGIGEWTHAYNHQDVQNLLQVDDGGFLLVCNDILVKTNTSGSILWEVFGRKNVNGILIDEDGGYLVSGKKDRYLTHDKFDSEGHSQWQRGHGNLTSIDVQKIIYTRDDGFVLIGSIYQDLYLSDVIMIKYSNQMHQEWNITFGGKRFDQANDVVQTNDGGFALVGQTWQDDGWIADPFEDWVGLPSSSKSIRDYWEVLLATLIASIMLIILIKKYRKRRKIRKLREVAILYPENT
ncbi:MAG: hypothetical protein ACXADW_19350 [Candidatus Hodarchaeales archaeon]